MLTYICIAALVKFCGIHLRAILQELVMNLSVTCVQRLHFQNSVLPHLQAANELNLLVHSAQVMAFNGLGWFVALLVHSNNMNQFWLMNQEILWIYYKLQICQ